jgi:hypothetical protein
MFNIADPNIADPNLGVLPFRQPAYTFFQPNKMFALLSP